MIQRDLLKSSVSFIARRSNWSTCWVYNIYAKSKNIFQEQQFIQSLHHLTHVYLWIKLKPNFYNPKTLQPLAWFRYIDVIFFFWSHGKKLLKFLEEHSSFDNNIEFSHESRKENGHIFWFNSEALERSFYHWFAYQRYKSTPVSSFWFLLSRSYQKIDCLRPKR